MGKTPEKQPYGATMGLRYRRKVAPATTAPETDNNSTNASSDPATVTAATSGKQRRQHQQHQQHQKQQEKERGNNQLEHQTSPRADAADADADTNAAAPPASARKKKHKQSSNQQQQEPSVKHKQRRKQLSPERAAEDRPASPVPSVAAVMEQPLSDAVVPTTTTTTLVADAGPPEEHIETTTTTAVAASPKPPKRQNRKKGKRNAPDAVVQNAEDEPAQQQQVVNVVSEPLRTQQQKEAAEPRRRKSFGASSKRKDSPSLMKQLLWKVKAPATAAAATTTTAAAAAVAAAPTATITPPIPEQAPVPASAPAVDESVREEEASEVDEEVAFAAEERQLLKRMATSLAKAMSSFPVESSSQETQSGSEDEASFVHYSLLGGDEAHEPSPAAFLLESCFPTPLALESVESAKLHSSSPKAQVHEILLDNFVFSPAELAIVKGDLVVWRVSEQTLGMVEHALDATLFDASGNCVRKTSTPLLRPGSGFAWRLDVAGRLEVECSVYKAQCAVQISESVAAKRRFARANQLALADPLRRPKKLSARAKRAARLAAASTAAADAAEESEVGSSESVEVFHRSKDPAQMDAGVCREVLSQLEDVKAAAAAAFIVVGDIACPVGKEAEDDGAGALESDVERDGEPDAGAENDEVGDFQQRIIAMLQKSEELQARQRDGFVVSNSGFNAGNTYKFFKRRFARVQNAEEVVVYARCPERSAPREGLTLSDVLYALIG